MSKRPNLIASAQASIFFSPSSRVPDQLYRMLPDSIHKRFDGQPIILPKPIDAPNEFPLLVLQNKDKTFQLTISALRADFVFAPRPPAGAEVLQPFFAEAVNDLCLLAKVESSIAVNRLAATLQRYAACENPARELAVHFCKDELTSNEPGKKGPLNRPENFELHAHKKFPTAFGVEVNSWVRNKSAKLRESDTPIILVEQDMNTPAENIDSLKMDESKIREFFAGILKELDGALEVYYPTKGEGAHK